MPDHERSNGSTVDDRLARIERLVFGEERSRSKGILQRLEAIEEQVELLVQQGAERRQLTRGIAIGLGLTTITSTGALITGIINALARGVNP